MMKLTLREIVSAVSTLNQIINNQFSGSLAFRISRIVRELRKETETFEAERDKIIMKYCERDENGEPVMTGKNSYKIAADKVDECNNEFNTLLDTEVEINANKLDMDDLDEFEITPNQMENIMVFFEE